MGMSGDPAAAIRPVAANGSKPPGHRVGDERPRPGPSPQRRPRRSTATLAVSGNRAVSDSRGVNGSPAVNGSRASLTHERAAGAYRTNATRPFRV
jgi:hypothetical protein